MVVSLGLVRPDWVMTVFDWTQSKRWPPLTPPLPPQEHTHTQTHTGKAKEKERRPRERERERERTPVRIVKMKTERMRRRALRGAFYGAADIYTPFIHTSSFFLLRLRLLVPRCFFFRISPLCLCVRRIFMAGLEGLRSLLYNDGRPVR